jgi:hypothetical protein
LLLSQRRIPQSAGGKTQIMPYLPQITLIFADAGGICGNLRNLREEKNSNHALSPADHADFRRYGGICGNLRNLREEKFKKRSTTPGFDQNPHT